MPLPASSNADRDAAARMVRHIREQVAKGADPLTFNKRRFYDATTRSLIKVLVTKRGTVTLNIEFDVDMLLVADQAPKPGTEAQ